MLVQGTGFNWSRPDHFRIVFLPHEPDLRIAIGRIAKFLADYRAKQGKKLPASANAESAKEAVASPVELAVDAD
ncbi:hypothetical protein G6F59_016067 [Rhizopus arrhizus]|nr:hypothetical protein G6F59_016067 [Rhizopus arrhizus]